MKLTIKTIEEILNPLNPLKEISGIKWVKKIDKIWWSKEYNVSQNSKKRNIFSGHFVSNQQ